MAVESCSVPSSVVSFVVEDSVNSFEGALVKGLVAAGYGLGLGLLARWAAGLQGD